MTRLYEVMQEGGEGHPHYWAEPYFGYYSSNDEWVLRKHAYMLADAGVDFVFFDTTNGNLHTFSHMALLLLRVWEQMREEGVNVPKIVFLCGGYDSEFQELYNSIYKKGLYEDLWYYWNGRPQHKGNRGRNLRANGRYVRIPGHQHGKRQVCRAEFQQPP